MECVPYVATGIVAMVLVGLVLYLRLKSRAAEAGSSETGNAKGVDPRESKLDRSAEKLRDILFRMADTLRRVDGAADNSTTVLSEARTQVQELDVAPPLQDAHTVLLNEIDRVITSNATLRSELDSAREELARQQEQIASLETAVRIDSLTRTGNRAAFDERLREVLERVKRHAEVNSLVMVDIDHFKSINDTYGHPAGDRILKGLALKLKASIRGTDFLARYGGEEFGILLAKTDLTKGTEVAESLREAVEHSNFNLDGKPLRVTVSAGVAQAKSEDSPDLLLKRADDALYRAKEAGRNVVVADEG